jgi:hypothetical protein
MYHTIGTWPTAKPEELADIVKAKAGTYGLLNGQLVSVTVLDGGMSEVIRQWETLEAANEWVDYMQGHNVTCQVVAAPE